MSIIENPKTGATVDTEALPAMPLCQIADVIRRDFKGKDGRMYFGAVPYADAMLSLGDFADMYGCDSGRSIVIYFLGNAQTWRGPVAKVVKAELKARLGR